MKRRNGFAAQQYLCIMHGCPEMNWLPARLGYSHRCSTSTVRRSVRVANRARITSRVRRSAHGLEFSGQACRREAGFHLAGAGGWPGLLRAVRPDRRLVPGADLAICDRQRPGRADLFYGPDLRLRQERLLACLPAGARRCPGAAGRLGGAVSRRAPACDRSARAGAARHRAHGGGRRSLVESPWRCRAQPGRRACRAGCGLLHLDLRRPSAMPIRCPISCWS